MATWFEITFTGEPTDSDRERAAELIRDGFTSGQLLGEPDAPEAGLDHDAMRRASAERMAHTSALFSDETRQADVASLGAAAPVFGKYTEAELKAAFELVKPAGNWKERIDTVVGPDVDLAVIDAATVFYTGGSIEYQPVTGGYRLTSGGYYANIGA
jgi:hypothetical protein